MHYFYQSLAQVQNLFAIVDTIVNVICLLNFSKFHIMHYFYQSLAQV